jgi:hypothetical protein
MVRLPRDCLLEKEMSYKYEKLRANLFTDEGQRRFLRIRDKVKLLLESAGAFQMSVMLHGGDWECMACVDRLVELGEIKEIDRYVDCPGQHRTFTSMGT